MNNIHYGGLFIGNTSATSNTALTGGAVYGADQASITIGNGTVFAGNEASTDGGAVACLECASLIIQDQVAMQMNHADAAGGALHVDSSTAIQSTNTTYFGNWYDCLRPERVCLMSMQCHAELVRKLHLVVYKCIMSLDVAVLTVPVCLMQGCRRCCCLHCRPRNNHGFADQLHQQHISVKCCQSYICWGGCLGVGGLCTLMGG